MVNHLEFLKGVIDDLKAQNLFSELPVLSSKQGAHVTLNGKDVLTLSTNNYLGFAGHPKLAEAAKAAIDKWGFGLSAVRQIQGTMEIHNELEEKLAKYKGTEASLVFGAGIGANRGTIQALMGPNDAIISDQLNHGSIIDGVRLTKSERKIYAHKNMEELETALKETKDKEHRLVVTDGVFSMDGDTAPLDQICELAEQYDAITMVDDAHGDGVMGKDGRGTANHYGVDGKLDIDMGTLSKAFGTLGGYIAGVQELRDYMTNRARSFIFTTAHPPAVCAATMTALDMIQNEPEHLKNLWDNSNYFKKEMSSLGFNTGQSESPITPVIVGEAQTAQNLSKRLFEEGVFVKPIVFPLVSKDTSRVRCNPTAEHTREDMDFAIGTFEKVGKELKII